MISETKWLGKPKMTVFSWGKVNRKMAYHGLLNKKYDKEAYFG